MTDEAKAEFRVALARAIHATKMSNADIGRAMGMSGGSQISRWINGPEIPSAENVTKLEELLGVTDGHLALLAIPARARSSRRTAKQAGMTPQEDAAAFGDILTVLREIRADLAANREATERGQAATELALDEILDTLRRNSTDE